MTNSAGNAPVLNTGVAPSLVWHLKEAAMTWKRTSEDLAKCEANLKHSLQMGKTTGNQIPLSPTKKN